MAKNINKYLIKYSVQSILLLTAWLARRPYLQGVTHFVMIGMAKMTIKSKKITHVDTLPELARQWQRGFPSAKQVPIKQISEDTVYAEIQTPCPLRGSGDVNACYRMMQYDRAIVSKAGGQFIVLRSQAEANTSVCQVAIRKAGVDSKDLTPAHVRYAH